MEPSNIPIIHPWYSFADNSHCWGVKKYFSWVFGKLNESLASFINKRIIDSRMPGSKSYPVPETIRLCTSKGSDVFDNQKRRCTVII